MTGVHFRGSLWPISKMYTFIKPLILHPISTVTPSLSTSPWNSCKYEIHICIHANGSTTMWKIMAIILKLNFYHLHGFSYLCEHDLEITQNSFLPLVSPPIMWFLSGSVLLWQFPLYELGSAVVTHADKLHKSFVALWCFSGGKRKWNSNTDQIQEADPFLIYM